MTRVNNILVLLTLVLCGCGVNKFPMDDAYHIPSVTSVAVATPQETEKQTVKTTTEPAQETPDVMFITVKDTTVTAVIKRK